LNDTKNDDFIRMKKTFEQIGGKNLMLFGEGGFGHVYKIEYQNQ
jgi:hypothetical protein